MIHDLDTTLENLIYDRGRMSRDDIDISFDQPTGEWAATLSRPTINCWLFDLRENVKLRSREMVVDRGAAMPGGRAMMKFAPLRFSLSYLVTAWTRRVEDEHQLLWRALAALAGIQTLAPEACAGGLRNQPFDIPLQVGQESDVQASMTDLWSVLGNEMRPGFFVTAALALDTEEVVEAPLVIEGRVDIGQSRRPDAAKPRIDAPDNVQIRLRGQRPPDEFMPDDER